MIDVWQVLILLLSQGIVVSWITDFFKRIDFVAQHPKLTAGLLNLAAIVVWVYGQGRIPPGAIEVLLSLIATLMTSIGAHELKDALFRWLRPPSES